MTDLANDERENQQNTQYENQNSPFELEGDEPSSAEAAAKALQEHQNKISEEDGGVFGLETVDASSETPVPAELAEDGFLEGLLDSTEGESTGKDGKEDTSDAPLILELEEAKKTIETLLYVAHEPLRPRDISMVFRGIENIDVKVVRKILAELMEEYADRTIQIVEVAEGYRMCTRIEFSPWVRRLLRQERRWRVSNAGLETLAIIAYKQPITKVEIEEIRRVDCGGAIHTLLERKLVRVLGRRDVIGRPIVYGTTPQFLEHFGFKNLTDMPKPEEFNVEMDLGDENPDSDIIPLESDGDEEGGEAPLQDEETAIPAHANGSANGHANGSANGHAKGNVIPAEEDADELEAATEDHEVENGHLTLAKTAEGEDELKTVEAAMEEDPEETGEEKEE